MKKSTMLIFSVFSLLLIFLISFGQTGDNSPDPMVNLGLLDDAIVTGSVPADSGRGLPTDILYDPQINGFRNPTDWQEYGVNYMQNLGPVTKDDPFYWQVEWPTEKNINYITCGGAYGNQPQPNTLWAVQYWKDDHWEDVAKAHDGWTADTLAGIGGWIDDGILQWRGLEPIVTTKLRIIAWSMPDSDLVSIHFRGRGGDGLIVKDSDQPVKAVLIQYLDFSGAEPDNEKDNIQNLGLLNECVVSSALVRNQLEYIRNQPADILFDLKKNDYYNITPWGEFGYPYQYDAGYVTEDEPFYWQVEWPVPKQINYFTWGGVYGNQPQPFTPWAVQYWDGSEWVTVMDGVGGSLEEGLSGVDVDAKSVWQSETPIVTTKFRLAVWSDGINPLVSFHIRGRGGSSLYGTDERDSTFKAVLVQYKDLETGIENSKVMDPSSFVLSQNYPNPFNPQTTIEYILPQRDHVKLTVFDLQGRVVEVLLDDMKNPGVHHVTFNGSSLSSGIYYYRMETSQGSVTRKMMLLK